MSIQARWRKEGKLFPLVAMTVVIVACGGGSVASPTAKAKASPTPTPAGKAKVTPSPTPTDQPSPTPTPTPKREVAGDIVAVTSQTANVDGAATSKGEEFLEGVTLSTSEFGSAQFTLRDKIKLCTMLPRSAATIRPADDLVMQFEAGTFVCETRTDPGARRFMAGTDVELVMSDPQFIVSFGDQGPRIQVLTGLIDVRSLISGASVPLGPMAQIDPIPGAVLPAATPWELNDLDPVVLRELKNFGPIAPDVSMPEVGSVVLDRMDESESIDVGVPVGLAPENLAFVDGFLDGQSKDWSLDGGSTQQIIADQDVAASLDAGTIDMFISPADLPGLGQVPLFVDNAGQQFWLYYDLDDQAFGAAQEEYLSNVVIDGNYRDVYLQELKAEPIYEGVDELFGLE